ncbi:MAG: hypothetical protein WC782_14725 [Methylococcaceae bacterium]|jgi:hypothetical protein
MADGTYHFGRKKTGYLKEGRFINVYDRLGKYLHGDNPWGEDKDLQNFALELPGVIAETYSLLELHGAFIKTPNFVGVWIVEANKDGTSPRIIEAEAHDEFVIKEE